MTYISVSISTKRIAALSSLLFIIMLAYASLSTADAGERALIQLRDFSQTEVKGGGFVLPSNMTIHCVATGSGYEKNISFGSSNPLYAYGWIINADTRELVWQMDRDNTSKRKEDRVFDDNIYLKKGSYEVYFGSYGFGSSMGFANLRMKLDRRSGSGQTGSRDHEGFFRWLQGLFGEDNAREWKKRSKNWGIEVFVDDRAPEIPMFSPPKELSNTIFKAVQLGDNEHIRQHFIISKPVPLRIYAIGEGEIGGELADYGWIVNTKTHKRVWDMSRASLRTGGGAEKNVEADNTINFPAGDFTLYYYTDDSHSFVDWNAPPPNDPFNYGITLIAPDPKDAEAVKLAAEKNEEENVIAQIIRVGDEETRSESFTLKKEMPVRIYALGERGNSDRQLADYGWIIDAKTRERVWTMDLDQTEHAGGADKNRMTDEVITLPRGSYTVFYQTDDSHAYNDWNSSPPFDPEHWGITIYGEGEHFSMADVEKHNGTVPEAGILAQIVRVGDNANSTKSFSLSQPTHVKIYALGEGQNREMYDYGWIEDARSGKAVWEMTYSMTFHAGGGRKNRMVSATILLDKGDYILHYVSDDSHSFNHWNTDPPDDPTMWGITLYKAE